MTSFNVLYELQFYQIGHIKKKDYWEIYGFKIFLLLCWQSSPKSCILT